MMSLQPLTSVSSLMATDICPSAEIPTATLPVLSTIIITAEQVSCDFNTIYLYASKLTTNDDIIIKKSFFNLSLKAFNPTDINSSIRSYHINSENIHITL